MAGQAVTGRVAPTFHTLASSEGVSEGVSPGEQGNGPLGKISRFAGRLVQAWEGTNKATYSYLANSPLVGKRHAGGLLDSVITGADS